MLRGTAALTIREMRTEARGAWPHVIRLVFALVVYVLAAETMSLRRLWTAPGLEFFQESAFLNYCAMTFAGLSFFATAITEEKEQQALGLLKLAGVNSLTLLAGKIVPRFLMAAFLLSVQLPFAMLAITLGGVTVHQVIAMYVALLAYGILLAGTGALASVLGPGSRSAILLATLLGSICSLGVFLFAALDGFSQWIGLDSLSTFFGNIWSVLSPLSIANQLQVIPTTGYAESIVSPQVIADVSMGLVAFALGCLLLPRFGDRPASARARLFHIKNPLLRPLAVKRPWRNAIAWKDFYFVAGGPGMVLASLLVPPLWGFALWFDYPEGLVDGMQVGSIVTSGLILAYGAVQIFGTEVQDQTLSTLFLLPQSRASIVYRKVWGCVLVALPVCVWLLVATWVDPYHSMENLELVVNDDGWLAIPPSLFGLHAAAYWSIRHRWRAVPFAILATGMVFVPLAISFDHFHVPNEMAYVILTSAYLGGALIFHLKTDLKLLEVAAA